MDINHKLLSRPVKMSKKAINLIEIHRKIPDDKHIEPFRGFYLPPDWIAMLALTAEIPGPF